MMGGEFVECEGEGDGGRELCIGNVGEKDIILGFITLWGLTGCLLDVCLIYHDDLRRWNRYSVDKL
jgi:hypothetical protein